MKFIKLSRATSVRETVCDVRTMKLLLLKRNSISSRCFNHKECFTWPSRTRTQCLLPTILVFVFLSLEFASGSSFLISEPRSSCLFHERPRQTICHWKIQLVAKNKSRLQTSRLYSAKFDGEKDVTLTDSGLFLPRDPYDDESIINIPHDATSKSSVSYQEVLKGLDQLYPPEELEERNALSRKDGYWRFVENGEEAPQGLTYGEYDIPLFAHAIDRARELYRNDEEGATASVHPQDNWTDMIFCDLGSGAGRLVLAAAALHKWKLCRGIELLESMHDAALENLAKCRVDALSSRRNDDVDSTSAEDDNTSPSWANLYKNYYMNSNPTDSWLNDLSNRFEDEDSEISSGENTQQQEDKNNDSTLFIPTYDANSVRNEAVSDDNNYKDDSGLFIPAHDVNSGRSEVVSDDNDYNSDSGLLIPTHDTNSESNEAVSDNNNFDADSEIDNTQVEHYLPTSSPTISSDDSIQDTEQKERLLLAPIEFSCGSFDDPYEYFGDADCIFVFSSAMPNDVLAMISRAVGRQCKPGCIVITTEYSLPLDGYLEPVYNDPSMPYGNYQLELVEELHGKCSVVGGLSTVFFHRVIQSLAGNGEGQQRRTKPEESVHDIAFRVAKALEAGELTDTAKFLRGVSNNIVFHQLPESWMPKL